MAGLQVFCRAGSRPTRVVRVQETTTAAELHARLLEGSDGYGLVRNAALLAPHIACSLSVGSVTSVSCICSAEKMSQISALLSPVEKIKRTRIIAHSDTLVSPRARAALLAQWQAIPWRNDDERRWRARPVNSAGALASSAFFPLCDGLCTPDSNCFFATMLPQVLAVLRGGGGDGGATGAESRSCYLDMYKTKKADSVRLPRVQFISRVEPASARRITGAPRFCRSVYILGIA